MSSLLNRADPSPALPSSVVSGLSSVIGIVGGVGPYAGLDLQHKILEQTIAAGDQDHLPVIAVSWPGPIPDRTEFLLGHVNENPAYPILEQLRLLANAGATVVGIPCNTAHAPTIFDVIRAGVGGFERPIRLLHMIDETAAHLAAHHPTIKTVGVLSTTGTWQARLYPTALEPLGYRVVVPDAATQEAIVHPAIYDPAYGIKATGVVTARARADLERGIAVLREMGAESVILGCTELPLAFPERNYEGLPLLDPTLALARGLVQTADPERLKPW
jgi:aspartate racemase